MDKKTMPSRAAVIEIASNSINMQISQLVKNEISLLETLEYPLPLGHDVYFSESISFEILRTLSDVLDKFVQPINTYKVSKTKIISGSILRDSENRSLVLDQIMVLNNLSIDVLDSNEEKAHIYMEVIGDLGDSISNGNSLIAYIGEGTIGVAVYDGNNIIHSQEIDLGATKLSDMLGGLRQEIEDFYVVVEECVNSIFKTLNISQFNIARLVLTGPEVPFISDIVKTSSVGKKSHFADHDNLSSLYHSIRDKSVQNISIQYDITDDEASVFYNAIFLCAGLVKVSNCKEIILSPHSTITSAFMKNLLIPKYESDFKAFVRNSAIACSDSLAKNLGYNSEHSRLIGDFSCQIFDSMKRVHGLDKNNKTLLRIASILFTCPALNNFRRDASSIADYINSIDIFGIKLEDMTKIALVASSDELSDLTENSEYHKLSTADQILVLKLSAIFHLSAALDMSEKSKIKSIKSTLKNNVLTVRAETSKNVEFERWAFESHANYFKSAFGISPELIITSKK